MYAGVFGFPAGKHADNQTNVNILRHYDKARCGE